MLLCVIYIKSVMAKACQLASTGFFFFFHRDFVDVLCHVGETVCQVTPQSFMGNVGLLTDVSANEEHSKFLTV